MPQLAVLNHCTLKHYFALRPWGRNSLPCPKASEMHWRPWGALWCSAGPPSAGRIIEFADTHCSTCYLEPDMIGKIRSEMFSRQRAFSLLGLPMRRASQRLRPC